jgi:hypothetical protein
MSFLIFLVIEGLIELESLGLHVFMVLLIGFRVADVITKPKSD